MRLYGIVFVALMSLSGCGVDLMGTAVMSNFTMTGATVASYSVLGKGPVDYALSQYRGQDCDIRNPKIYDGKYCVNPPAPSIEPPIYCYRSLASTECSSVIDPYHNHNQPIVGGPGALLAEAAAAEDKRPAMVLPEAKPAQPAPVVLAPAKSVSKPPKPAEGKDPAVSGS